MPELQLLPVISEKALALAEAEGTYTFIVPKNAGKIELKKAINGRYKVKAKAVNTAILKGKPQASLVKRGSRRLKGQRSDFKKAYVTLAKGDKIELVKESK